MRPVVGRRADPNVPDAQTSDGRRCFRCWTMALVNGRPDIRETRGQLEEFAIGTKYGFALKDCHVTDIDLDQSVHIEVGEASVGVSWIILVIF